MKPPRDAGADYVGADCVEADYVIVGAGAAGMAFADTLLSESNASMIIVDRRHQPGGLWNDAYPFVRLHAPSTLYGVNSRPLGSGHTGELASRAELVAYFDQVMRERLLPSGRVRYLPMHDYRAGGTIVSRIDGRHRRVRARVKHVDATFADTRLPATHAPGFRVADGVTCVAPNALPRLQRPADGFVLVGAGKTAMDTAVWLLEQGVDADRITWIRPRDAWLLDRANVQTGVEAFERTIGSFVAEVEAARAAQSVADLFARLEAAGVLQRIDRTVEPTMYRCAIVSATELAQLRRITRVVRMGHVRAIERDRIVLDHGTIPSSPDRVHIHCAADGIPRRPAQPIFQPGRIVPQYVRRCSPMFSAALVAHVEATIDGDDAKNALCRVVPVPDEPLDWLRMLVHDAQSSQRWNRVPTLRRWLAGARLNAHSAMIDAARREPTPSRTAILDRYRLAIGPAVARLTDLLAAADEKVCAV